MHLIHSVTCSSAFQPCLVSFPQFRSCMRKMLGMSGGDDEDSSTSQSVTEVSKVSPSQFVRDLSQPRSCKQRWRLGAVLYLHAKNSVQINVKIIRQIKYVRLQRRVVCLSLFFRLKIFKSNKAHFIIIASIDMISHLVAEPLELDAEKVRRVLLRSPSSRWQHCELSTRPDSNHIYLNLFHIYFSFFAVMDLSDRNSLANNQKTNNKTKKNPLYFQQL